MAGRVGTVVAVVAWATGLLAGGSGCAFPLPEPSALCQKLSACPEDAREILVRVNAGGPAVPPFAADNAFIDGASRSTAVDVDVSGVEGPAPDDVYRTARYASGVSFQYTFDSLELDQLYFVRLHFMETGDAQSGDHLFNVDVNGQLGLNQVDIALEAGGTQRALIREFGVRLDAQGVIELAFVSLPGKGSAEVSGIEIWRPL